jgi:hypothetical protein
MSGRDFDAPRRGLRQPRQVELEDAVAIDCLDPRRIGAERDLTLKAE